MAAEQAKHDCRAGIKMLGCVAVAVAAALAVGMVDASAAATLLSRSGSGDGRGSSGSGYNPMVVIFGYGSLRFVASQGSELFAEIPRSGHAGKQFNICVARNHSFFPWSLFVMCSHVECSNVTFLSKFFESC